MSGKLEHGHLAQLALGKLASHGRQVRGPRVCQCIVQLDGTAVEVLLPVAREADHRRRPRGRLTQHKIGLVHRRRSKQARGELQEPVFDEGQLEDVLHEVSVPLVAEVCSRVQLKVVHRRLKHNIEAEDPQHFQLHEPHLLGGVCTARLIGQVPVPPFGFPLDFCGNGHAHHPQKLKPVPRNGLQLEEPADEARCQEQGVRLVLEYMVDLHEPVDQDPPHPGPDVRLVAPEVAWRLLCRTLRLPESAEDVADVLGGGLRGVEHILNGTSCLCHDGAHRDGGCA
mmetsp:Transcript_23167/g.53092  ORF Transcript_23167/g.53092 Transcript_23167/m.53092 type:complete len:283 (-) Transcript_23167:297-1145(-)